MVQLVVLSALLCAQPEERVLVLDLLAADADRDSAAAVAADLAAHLAQSTPGAVATADDVRSMLRLAGEKQLLGCLDESCAPRLAEVLDATHVIYGTLRRVETTWELNVVQLDAHNAAAKKRTAETAPSLPTLRARVPAVADDIALSLRSKAAGDVAAGATLLKNRNDAVWAAMRVHRLKERKLEVPKRVYVASFDGAQFDFAEFDRMRSGLPLARRLLFPGPFPACHGRTDKGQDAFYVEPAQSLAAVVERRVATSLAGRRKDRKVTLELAFEFVDVSLQALPPPDPALCGPAERERTADLSPTVTIRVVGGAIVDAEQGTRARLGNLDASGVSYSALPDTKP